MAIDAKLIERLASIPVHDGTTSADVIRELTSTAKGMAGEKAVCALLRRYGFTVSQAPYISPFDLLCSGKRIEVKVSEFDEYEGWRFNIHRHGVLDESQVDVYVLRLEKVPYSKAAIHLFIPAPLEVPTIAMSFRSLMVRWGKFYNNFELFSHAKETL